MVKARLHICNYKKGETILFGGEVCEKILFLNTGITRMYYVNEEAKEFTCQISFNDKTKDIIDYFAVDYNSFMTKTNSTYSIEVLKDIECVEITFDDMEYLSAHTTIFIQLHTKVNQLIHTSLKQDLIDFNMLSNVQRYEYFIEKYNTIHTKIPQYIVASYLGITPVALSRLKQRL